MWRRALRGSSRESGDFFVTVFGQNLKGNTIAQSFRFINRKTSKNYLK
tara:strand:- start:277 stop:420 length:144 start_codon:yes stop_codon:yes gene_type:complete